jgi:hypothetical protein
MQPAIVTWATWRALASRPTRSPAITA